MVFVLIWVRNYQGHKDHKSYGSAARDMCHVLPAAKGSFSRNYATKKDKEKKHKELPVPPKKPMTAYLDFYVSHLDEIKENNKDAKNVKEYSKISSKMWKEVNKDEKAEYEERYQVRKAAYQDELKHFNDGLTEKQKEEMKEAKLQKKEDKIMKRERREKLANRKKYHMPKKPANAYAIYVRQRSHDRPAKVATKDFMKTLGEEWQALSDIDKKPYFEESQVEKEAYEEKISGWLQQMVEDGNGEVIEKGLLKKELDNLGRPKGPKSGFQIYLANNHLSAADNKWTKMSEEDREPYMLEAKGEKQRYKDEVAEWMENMEALGKEDFVLEAQVLLKRGSKKTTSKKAEKSEKHEISSSESDDEE